MNNFIEITLPIVIAVAGFALGFILAKVVKQAPSIREIKHENTCVMFDNCASFINSSCISGHCNMHCRTYCQCGASENPPRKEEWQEKFDEV